MMNGIKKFFSDNWVYIVLVCAALFFGQRWFDSRNENQRLHKDLVGKTEQYQQLTDHAAKLEIQYKDQKELIDKLKTEWSAEKSRLSGRVKVLSNATFMIREKARETGQSDLIYQGKKMKYVVNEIKFENGPPVGYVLIFDDGRVTSKLYNHEIDVKTAVLRDEKDGVYNIASKANYILKSPSLNLNDENWYDKPYPLKINGGTAVVDPTEPKYTFGKRFMLWAPNFNGGVNFYMDDITPTVGVSIMGYGYSVRDLAWKFVQIGAEFSGSREGFAVNLMPVLYRPLPGIFHNSYVGLGASIDGERTKYFLGLSVGF